MEPTAAQRSAAVAGVFDRVADSYDTLGVPWFGPIAERLLTELAPQQGERALDVGSGRGAVLFRLADAVGPDGAVTGIDLSSRMVEACRADLAQRPQEPPTTPVELHVMDGGAPDLPPGSYDLVVSSLVLFFLPDPAGAVRAWYDLLVPGGRVGVSTFGPQDDAWRAVDDVFTPYLPQRMLDARTSGRSGPFASDAGVERLLTDAGLQEVTTTTLDLQVRFDDAEQWRAWTWSHGQRVMWEAVPEQERPAVLARAAEVLDAARGTDGRPALGQQVRFTVGWRPDQAQDGTTGR